MGKLVRLAKNVFTGEIAPKRGFDSDWELLDLVYDTDTYIVYHKFSERVNVKSGRGMITTKIGYMCPYLGKNGKYCRFEKDQIIEIQ